MKPKISIITVTYNCAPIIEETVQSVLAQTYPNIEYIIIDGLSSDGTIDIIKKYEHNLAYWNSEKDTGIYSAMNKGLQRATGSWVFFQNAGDVFYSNSVLCDIDFENYEKDPNIGFIFGRVMKFTKKGIQPVKFDANPFYSNPKILKGMGFSHQAVFTRTDLAKKVRFNEDFKLCADYNMFVTIVNKGYAGKELKIFISIIDSMDGTSKRNQITQFKETAFICNYTNKLGYYLKYLRICIRILKNKIINK